MPTFRLGDRGSAVAEIRSILSGQGLLSSTPGRHAAPESAGTPTPNGPSNGEAAQNGAVIHSTEDALFDIDVDHAVRAFQQQRGGERQQQVDGRPGERPQKRHALSVAQSCNRFLFRCIHGGVVTHISRC